MVKILPACYDHSIKKWKANAPSTKRQGLPASLSLQGVQIKRSDVCFSSAQVLA